MESMASMKMPIENTITSIKYEIDKLFPEDIIEIGERLKEVKELDNLERIGIGNNDDLESPIDKGLKSQLYGIFVNIDDLEKPDVSHIYERLGRIENFDNLKTIRKNIDRLEEGESDAMWSKYLSASFLGASILAYLMNNFKVNDSSIILGFMGLCALYGYYANKSDHVKPAGDNIRDGMAIVFGEKAIQSKSGYNRAIEAVVDLCSYIAEKISPLPLYD